MPVHLLNLPSLTQICPFCKPDSPPPLPHLPTQPHPTHLKRNEFMLQFETHSALLSNLLVILSQVPVEAAAATQQMSLNMDGWAAMTEALPTQAPGIGNSKETDTWNERHDPFSTETGTQLGSIAGWQAIAADVSRFLATFRIEIHHQETSVFMQYSRLLDSLCRTGMEAAGPLINAHTLCSLEIAPITLSYKSYFGKEGAALS